MRKRSTLQVLRQCGAGEPRTDAKTVTALIICHTKDFVSIFVEAKLYSKAKPREYTAIFTRGPLTRVPTASSKQGKRLGGVAGSMQPSTETSEGLGGFDADYAFLYQFFMKMRRIATTGGCITTAPTQESRPRVSPEPAASKGSFPVVLRAAQSPVQSRKRRFGDFLAPAGFCINFCINFWGKST